MLWNAQRGAVSILTPMDAPQPKATGCLFVGHAPAGRRDDAANVDLVGRVVVLPRHRAPLAEHHLRIDEHLLSYGPLPVPHFKLDAPRYVRTFGPHVSTGYLDRTQNLVIVHLVQFPAIAVNAEPQILMSWLARHVEQMVTF